MKPKDDIERLVQSVRATTSAAVDEHILSDAAKALAQAVQHRSPVRPTIIKIGLQTMQRHWKPAAAAIAAAVIIAVMLIVLQNSASPAYAIEQTMRASHSVRFIHIRLEDLPAPAECPQDIWAEFRDNGDPLRLRVEKKTGRGLQTAVWQGDKAIVHVEKPDVYVTVREEEGANNLREMLTDADPKLLVSQLQDLQLQGKVHMEVQAPQAPGQPIAITADYAKDMVASNEFSFIQDRVVLDVDPDTKLVTRVRRFSLQDGQHKYVGQIKYMDYNRPIDAAVFDLPIPPGAVTADKYSQPIGIERGTMTEKQVALELVRQAVDAIVAQDWAKAGRLCDGIDPNLLRSEFGTGGRVVRIISISDPEAVKEFHGYSLEFNAEIEQAGVKQNFSRRLYVHPVEGQPGRWSICGGY